MGAVLQARITSTYVENTYEEVLDSVMDEDHLHIRGEYKHAEFGSEGIGGSPPHTWRIPVFSYFVLLS